MLKIRLQRIGKRGQAYFKVIVTEHTQKPKGQYLELLGSYDPHKNELNVDGAKVKHWLGQGAKMSETVNNLLVGKGVIEGEKVQVWKPKRRKDGGAPTEASKKKAGEGQMPESKPAKLKAELQPEIKEKNNEKPKEKIKAEEPATTTTEAPAVT